jgi:hypothetical protein
VKRNIDHSTAQNSKENGDNQEYALHENKYNKFI